MKELISINKYFKLCESIGEAYQVINERLELKKYELKEINTNISLIIISDDKLWGNYNFEIPLIQKTEKEDINEIYELIKKLKLENIKISNEKKIMKEKLKSEIKILKEQLENMKKENEWIKNTSEKNFQNIKALIEQYKQDFEKMKQFGFPFIYKNPKNNCGNSTAQIFQTQES